MTRAARVGHGGMYRRRADGWSSILYIVLYAWFYARCQSKQLLN